VPRSEGWFETLYKITNQKVVKAKMTEASTTLLENLKTLGRRGFKSYQWKQREDSGALVDHRL